MKIVVFGRGEVVSCPGLSHGHPAVILDPAKKPGEVGKHAIGYDGQPSEDSVVLEFQGNSGLRVLMEDIHTAFEMVGVPYDRPAGGSLTAVDEK